MPAQLLVHDIHGVTVVNFRDVSMLDSRCIDAIAQELYHLVEAQAVRKLVLDFSKVKFLSSQALGVLISLRTKADAINGQVVLAGLRPDLMKIFKIMSIHKLFRFCASEQEALANL